jgi:hypothetical protein
MVVIDVLSVRIRFFCFAHPQAEAGVGAQHLFERCQTWAREIFGTAA